jgi:hypothetical protein
MSMGAAAARTQPPKPPVPPAPQAPDDDEVMSLSSAVDSIEEVFEDDVEAELASIIDNSMPMPAPKRPSGAASVLGTMQDDDRPLVPSSQWKKKKKGAKAKPEAKAKPVRLALRKRPAANTEASLTTTAAPAAVTAVDQGRAREAAADESPASRGSGRDPASGMVTRTRFATVGSSRRRGAVPEAEFMPAAAVAPPAAVTADEPMPAAAVAPGSVKAADSARVSWV